MICTPGSAAELSEWLRSRPSRPLEVHGSYARTGSSDQLVMGHLNKLILYEPEEMIIQCEAGIRLSELTATLASSSQWIPTLVASESESTTLGGALAEDVYHPRALSGISLRTAVLGGTFSTMEGELFRSGSRVVKSVAGYDTHRAFVGSQGLLGPIIQVTLRVLPMPECFLRFRTSPLHKGLIVGCMPAVVEETTGELLVEFAGYHEDIESINAKIREAGIEFNELDAKEWNDGIRSMRIEKVNAAAHDNKISELGRRLQLAFDFPILVPHE